MPRKKKSNPPSDVQGFSVKAVPSTNLDVQTPPKPAKATKSNLENEPGTSR